MSDLRERLYERLLGDDGALTCDHTSMATREDVEAMLDEIDLSEGAAPRAEGLDSPKEFGRIVGKVMQANPKADAVLVNDILRVVRDNSRPSDERVPESEEAR